MGEKTITRDNISVNKDRTDWKQGKSESDQIMARALMTPDELRRMDVDECIIYEKGLKPIKAHKYYYFKYPEGKLVSKYKVDHNDVQIDRGPWRTMNPNNPFSGDEDGEGREVSTIDKLDDLFDDDEKEYNESTGSVANSNESKEELTDIQKELEAKFDELFGAIDDED